MSHPFYVWDTLPDGNPIQCEAASGQDVYRALWGSDLAPGSWRTEALLLLQVARGSLDAARGIESMVVP